MLIPQQASRVAERGQGRPAVSFAELRRRLARPSSFTDGIRQRLLDLERRLAAVQALGDEYARVEFSEYVQAATGPGARIPV